MLSAECYTKHAKRTRTLTSRKQEFKVFIRFNEIKVRAVETLKK